MRYAMNPIMIVLALPANSQSFSCSMGTSPACLGFGESVCSLNGVCVNKEAACFDKYQCDFEGFTCKSNVTDCVKENTKLLDDYNALVRDHNDLVKNYSELRDAANVMSASIKATTTCLARASSLDEAHLCAP